MWFIAQKPTITSVCQAMNPSLGDSAISPSTPPFKRSAMREDLSGGKPASQPPKLSLGTKDRGKGVVFPLTGDESVDRAPRSSKQNRDVQITLGLISRICATPRSSQTGSALFTHKAGVGGNTNEYLVREKGTV